MKVLTIAARNIFRNTRRSVMTISAITIGTVAVLLFGGFVRGIEMGAVVTAVQRDGHLLVSRAGYFDFGSADPGAFGIEDYTSVMKTIETDPVLKPLIAVATPIVRVFGIAGNFPSERSQTFVGFGFDSGARDRMLQWDEYDLPLPPLRSALDASDSEGGVLGMGLARMLDLCEPLHIAKCPAPPTQHTATGAVDPAIAAIGKSVSADPTDAATAGPRIDLLGATAMGAPNVVSLHVLGTEQQTLRELDDVYVGMPLKLAQTLLFGRRSNQATGIVIQLRHTATLELARARLNELIARDRLPLEVHDFWQLQPIFVQIVNMFRAIFAFMAVIIVAIVVFMVTNTMMMSVIERTTEIGTIRALGLRRAGVRLQFVVEGLLLGLVGASIGLVLAFIAADLFDAAHLTWRPPMSAEPVPFISWLEIDSPLPWICWAALIAVTTLAALFPANRAARMEVMEALRHV